MVIVNSGVARDHQDLLVWDLLHHHVSLLDDDVVSSSHVSPKVAPARVPRRTDRALVRTFRLGEVGSQMILREITC